jgi:hypothetical protein
VRKIMQRIHEWLEETHSAAFELRRHFFLRFFDSDLVSTPGQWQVVAGGVLAVLLSLSLIYVQAYYHKYAALNALPTPEPLQRALLADTFFLITLAMSLIGLFTTLQWPQLFPGLRDYLALGSLPVRVREIFVAKFTALLAFAGLFIVAVTLLPSLVLPMVMAGRWVRDASGHIPALFVSSSVAALFVFFSSIALQGVMLNLTPIRHFTRISLAAQGALLTALLCGLPLVFSIANLQDSMDRRPAWIVWVPPAWYLGLDQVMDGNREPMAVKLAWRGVGGLAGAAGAALITYLWSYRRHRVRLLESPVMASNKKRRGWIDRLADRLIPDPRELAVFAFVAKTLARSRQHRLVLTAFAAIAVAVIFESFVSLSLSRGFRGFSVPTPALRQAAVSAPLALSLFVLAGFRYLFRLPVELRANWVFRVNEPGNRMVFLAATERFLLYCAVAPVALIALPVEVGLLGVRAGIAATILCLLPSLILTDLLLLQFEKVPFTSSYLPGRRPVIQTLLIYAGSMTMYVTVLGGIVTLSLRGPGTTLGLFGLMLAVWFRVRLGRLENWKVGKLEFEELPEPAVQTLSILRD